MRQLRAVQAQLGGALELQLVHRRGPRRGAGRGRRRQQPRVPRLRLALSCARGHYVQAAQVVLGDGEGRQLLGLDSIIDPHELVPVGGVEQVERARVCGRAGDHEAGHLGHVQLVRLRRRRRLAGRDVLRY